jgi:hypothetical protein
MTSPFQDALREELLAAARRDLQRASRRRRGRIGAAVAAAVASVAGGIAILVPSPAAAEVEVRVDHGVVEVRLKDLDTSADEVRAALSAKGLRARVVGVPVGPSLVGRFVGVEITQDPDQPIERFADDGFGFDGFRVHEGWAGELVLDFGRAAGRGEPYGAGSDAFAAGEPLHCSGTYGASLADAEGRLRRLQVEVVPEGRIGGPLALDAPELAPDADWFVRGARALAADHVLLQIGPTPPDAPAGAGPEEGRC